MQNRYAGDVGDFGKLGMLRYLARTGLSVGVNWYLTANECHNADGKHVGYLHDPKFFGCDDELLGKLKRIVDSGQRSVESIQNSRVVPNCIFYDKSVVNSEQCSREEWHQQAVEALRLADIVFLDPDNGILPQSVSENGGKSVKYIFPKELNDYYQAGHSIVFYNHRRRLREDEYLRSFLPLFHPYTAQRARIMGVKFLRGTLRDYLFIIRPEHSEQVKQALGWMLDSDWDRHFKALAFT